MKQKSTLLAQSSQKSDSLYLLYVILFRQMQGTSLKSFLSPHQFFSVFSTFLFSVWFCSFICRYYLTETLYKIFLIFYSHPNLIMLSTLSLFTFVSFFYFSNWFRHPHVATSPTYSNLTRSSIAAPEWTCALTSREVCSKLPRQVMDWFTSHAV